VNYKEVKTIEFPNMVVRVHVPELTPEERAKRMEAIRRTASALLKKGK
jgi:hypothetical protein